jgi:transcriptional regulator with XRE-family HTH domain
MHASDTQGKDATAVAQGSPTVRRRELGALLRTLRTEKGLTVEQVAERLLCSPSKVSRMETGHRGATLRDVRDLCDLYGVTDQAERDRLMTLAKEGKQYGWWQSYELPISTYIGLEAEAVSIKDYDSAIIPGLMQTADYARAMHDVVIPNLAPGTIEKHVEARLTRQRRLSQKPKLNYYVILDEAALHRSVGGPSVMAVQLNHLIELTNLSNVTLQVIPYSAGAHPALDSTFNILEFTSAVPAVVYVEGLVGWIYIDRPQDIQRYQQVFERLSDIALSPQESIELVARIRDKHNALIMT